jgi:hypothetical protein
MTESPRFPPVPPLMPWEIERMQAHFGWPPTAEIRRRGRWSYRVSIVPGPGVPDAKTVHGARRAQRKASRMLARFIAKCERERDWALQSKTIGDKAQ